MSEKTREICTVVSQESIGAGIYSMWIQTDRIAADAKPGQFVSLYTNDKSKILPRPISLCEIDKENGRLHLVYRVTGQGTGTDEFSQMKAGDTIPVLGPLGNGFPVEKAEGKTVFLMGGGIGVPPILELAKQMKCEKNRSLQDTGTVIPSSERNLRRREHFILPQRMAVWEQKAMSWMPSEKMLWKRT